MAGKLATKRNHFFRDLFHQNSKYFTNTINLWDVAGKNQIKDFCSKVERRICFTDITIAAASGLAAALFSFRNFDYAHLRPGFNVGRQRLRFRDAIE